MKPREALGRYGCVPLELNASWIDNLSYYARAIGLDLVSRVTDYKSMSLDVTADWKTSLCKRLQVPGKERRNAKAALESLEAGGFLTVVGGFVRINLIPEVRQPCAVDASTGDRGGSVVVPSSSPLATVVVPNSTQVSETIKNTNASYLSSYQAEPSSGRLAANQQVKGWKPRTFGEPPPGFNEEPTERSSWLRFWDIYERTLGIAKGAAGHPIDHRNDLEVVTAAVEAEAGTSDPVAFEIEAQRLLRAWSADSYFNRFPNKRTPFNLRKNLARYAKIKAKPPVAVVDDGSEAVRRRQARLEAVRLDRERVANDSARAVGQ